MAKYRKFGFRVAYYSNGSWWDYATFANKLTAEVYAKEQVAHEWRSMKVHWYDSWGDYHQQVYPLDFPVSKELEKLGLV